MDRRRFLGLMGGAACCDVASRLAGQQASSSPTPNFVLNISPVKIEIAPGRIIKTTGYNGSAPGPILRLQEGKPVTIEVRNDTSEPEFVHWHGLFAPSSVDGAVEEGTPAVAAHGRQAYSFVPRPSGTRWYHTHVSAGRNLKRSTYTGQFGILYVEPNSEPGHYDAEVFLTLHGWDPYLSTMGDEEGFLEVAYTSYSVNAHALGYGEPIRVQKGQRVLFRIVNASATLQHRLALSGHSFTVLALDGNPVPTARTVEVLHLGPAERADVVVTMDQPGIWVLGELDDKMRKLGLGIIVEYAAESGQPRWVPPADTGWDYTIFGQLPNAPVPDAEVVPLVFRSKFVGRRWVQHWTINGKSFPETDPILVKANHRYRLRFDNQSEEAHPLHLHRHSFELMRMAGKPTAGILKDVVMVPARSQVEVDFVADNPGPSLLHCHMQLHMDFGFMTMLQYRE
jgi:FtsP/CotA-like multicopper oxidase with cupredoxin domain